MLYKVQRELNWLQATHKITDLSLFIYEKDMGLYRECKRYISQLNAQQKAKENLDIKLNQSSHSLGKPAREHLK